MPTILVHPEHNPTIDVFGSHITVVTDSKSVVQKACGHAAISRLEGRLHNPRWDQHVHVSSTRGAQAPDEPESKATVEAWNGLR